MFTIDVDKRVKGEPESIWRLITDSQGFAAAAPDVVRVEDISGREETLSRRVHHRSGRSWEEHCKEWLPHERYTMQIDTGGYPLPVNAIRRGFTITPLKRNVRLGIHYEYTASMGPLGYFIDKYQIRPVLTLFATQLLDNLARRINEVNTNRVVSAQALLDGKDNRLYTITPGTRIAEACRILTDQRIGCVIAVDGQQGIVGILSERDVVNAIANAGGKPVLDNAIDQHMTHDVILCRPEDSMHDIMSCMSKNRIRHLPVADGARKLLGVISIGDIVNYRMSELQQETDAMHQYIEGRKWREVAMQYGRDAAAEDFT